MSDLSTGDVLAMQNRDGLFGGNGSGFIILILFILLASGNGIGGLFGGNGAASQGALTRAELYEGLSGQDIKNELGNISTGMCAGFNSVNSNINQVGFNMQQCCCDIKTAVHSEGEATRALIQSNTIQDLRDRLADKDRELLSTGLVTAQTIQTNNLENFIRNAINGGCGCNS